MMCRCFVNIGKEPSIRCNLGGQILVGKVGNPGVGIWRPCEHIHIAFIRPFQLLMVDLVINMNVKKKDIIFTF